MWNSGPGAPFYTRVISRLWYPSRWCLDERGVPEGAPRDGPISGWGIFYFKANSRTNKPSEEETKKPTKQQTKRLKNG